MKYKQRIIFISIFLTFVVSKVAAIEVIVVDQNGKPVEHAVISTPNEAPYPAPNQHAVMDQVNKQFQPRVLTINKGQWVNFPNSDNIRHHVYSFSSAKPFEMRLFRGTESPPVQFNTPGIVVLGCNIHDKMVGYIYIADNEDTAITNNQGKASLANVNSDLFVWHARLSANHSKRIQVAKTSSPNQTQTVVLTLLPEQTNDTTHNTFGSRKFGNKE